MPYSIDMYHGEDSGHLILFVDSQIVMIKFNQKANHKHSFIIDNQILEFEIKEKDQNYKYSLTPQLPQAPDYEKQKYFDQHFWIPLILIIIAIYLFIALFIDTFY